MITYTMSINEVFHVEGDVVDCALISPHNSFLNTNDHYLVTIGLPTASVVEQIENKFRNHEHPYLPHENVWKEGAYRITVTTLSAPRMHPLHKDQEYRKGEVIHLAVKADLVIGAEAAIERLLLVGINSVPDTGDSSLQSGTAQEYNW